MPALAQALARFKEDPSQGVRAAALDLLGALKVPEFAGLALEVLRSHRGRANKSVFSDVLGLELGSLEDILKALGLNSQLSLAWPSQAAPFRVSPSLEIAACRCLAACAANENWPKLDLLHAVRATLTSMASDDAIAKNLRLEVLRTLAVLPPGNQADFLVTIAAEETDDEILAANLRVALRWQKLQPLIARVLARKRLEPQTLAVLAEGSVLEGDLELGLDLLERAVLGGYVGRQPFASESCKKANQNERLRALLIILANQ